MTTKSKPTQRLTAQRMLGLYLATRAPDAPVGEILRGYGLHLDDLREIEQTIESAALAALKVRGRHGRQPRDVSPPAADAATGAGTQREDSRPGRVEHRFHRARKKRARGVPAREPGQPIAAETRPVMRELVAEAKAEGLPETRACQVLRISPRSLQRWRRPTPPQAPAAARPRPVNALTRDEAATVVSLIRSAEHADQSCRELALSLEMGSKTPGSVSPVTVWRYQVALGCAGPRGRQVSQRVGPAPDTDWVTGANQLWDWDVTVLRAPDRWVFWYLYSLLDHFSRKNLAWHVGDVLSSDYVQALWDQGLTNEGLLDRPRDAWPKSLSDRGAPVRSYSTRQYFIKLGIAQLFSRPRTPNDNPRIEAHFGTLKTHPVYPGWFIDVPAAVTYFTGFYDWPQVPRPSADDARHGYAVTPNQVHAGQAATLLAERQAHQSQALAARRDACHRPFTLEELIAEPLPDVSRYPVFTWAGPNAVPQNTRHPLRN